MENDEARLCEALSGTSLAGRAVRVSEVPGSTSVGLEVAGRPGELPEAWEEARALVDATDRWPLAVGVRGEDVYSRFYHHCEAETPDVVLARASGMTFDEAMQRLPQEDISDYLRSDWTRIVDYSLEETERRIGSAPAREEVDAAIPAPDRLALERYLFEWEETRRPTTRPEEPGFHDPSYVYDVPYTMAFLPTARGASVPAYTDFWTCQRFGHERLVVALEHWQQTYDAEPVANIGTMMCLRVGRPPQTMEDAWQVTVELDRFSDGPDVSLRELARATLASPVWILLGRP